MIVNNFVGQGSVKKNKDFNEFGLTVHSGSFGNGRLASMVNYLDRMHEKYPAALIVTNFEYKYATHLITDCNELFSIRNGSQGVIYAIDGFHNLFNNEYPERLVSEIVQQRRLHMKIVATCISYWHISPHYRQLIWTVVQSKRLFYHMFSAKEYDAGDYENMCKRKIYPLKSRMFISGC